MIFKLMCIVFLLGTFIGSTHALKCYQCSRITVTDYKSQTESDVMQSLDDAIEATLSQDCTKDSLGEDIVADVDDGNSCVVMQAEFTLEYGGETLEAEAQTAFDGEYDVSGTADCFDFNSDTFKDATNDIANALDGNTMISNTGGFNGDLCFCDTDKCNTDTATLKEAESTETTTSGSGILGIETFAYVLLAFLGYYML